MLEPVGFWSYARQDDSHSDGQLSQLRAIVGKAIVLQYGVDVTLWQDISAIPYGADWAETIERTIGQTTFFIPIVTPRFLRSTHCRDEFLSFRRRMQSLGRNDLIFPVHYVGVEDVKPEETVFGDELAALRRSQWIDFRPLFYADPKSPEVRRWSGDLAASVLKTLRQPTATSPYQERTTGHGSATEAASKSVLAEPPVSLLARDAQQMPPRPTVRVQPPTPAGQSGSSSRRLLIPGAIGLVCVIAAGVGIFQLQRLSGVPATSVPNTPPLTSAAPSLTPPPPASVVPSETPAEASPAPPPTTVAAPAKSEACGGSGVPLPPLASRTPDVLTAAEECSLKPKDVFRECADCPAMVVIPAGSFTMGSPASEPGRGADEGPQHDVGIAKPLAVGKFQVTVNEFKAFVAATGYDASTCLVFNGKFWQPQSDRSWRDPGFAQTGLHPAACLNWYDAQAYAKWLSSKTGKSYRLLSEAEWEYAARGQTQPGNYPRYFFGDSEAELCKYGNGADQTARKQIPGAENWTISTPPCSDGYAYTSPVGSFIPNAFGLFDIYGNVSQWVEDCYHSTYSGAPADGEPWTEDKCEKRVLRGSAWYHIPRYHRVTRRDKCPPSWRTDWVGFRVARTLSP